MTRRRSVLLAIFSSFGFALSDAAIYAAPDASPVRRPNQTSAADNSVAGDAAVELRGQVVDEKSRPVSALRVYAVERGSARIVASVRPDPDGLFLMKLPPRIHDFGVMASRWMIGGYERTSQTAVKLVVVAAFPDADPVDVLSGAKSWATVTAPTLAGTASGGTGPSIGRLTGVVTDETGAPLHGVRLLTLQESSERLVAVTQTDREGRYTLFTLAGRNRLYVYAPGLKLKDARGDGPGRIDLTLAIDTEIETITLRTGRRLAFRVTDSIYPEMLPPRKVASVLSFDYGIALAEGCFCPGDLINQPPPTSEESRDACVWSKKQSGCADPNRCPSTMWARACRVPQYWWLRLIQVAPPNPSHLRNERDLPTMWWYDDVRAMQVHDARIGANSKGP